MINVLVALLCVFLLMFCVVMLAAHAVSDGALEDTARRAWRYVKWEMST